MAILKYFPKKYSIIDRRNSEGGYYEAECEECGTIFYPKKSNAKYCGHGCMVMAYRKRKENTTSTKKVVKTPKVATKKGITKVCDVIGAKSVPDVLYQNGANISGKMGIIRDKCKELEQDNSFEYDKFQIIRVSACKYSIYK